MVNSLPAVLVIMLQLHIFNLLLNVSGNVESDDIFVQLMLYLNFYNVRYSSVDFMSLLC